MTDTNEMCDPWDIPIEERRKLWIDALKSGKWKPLHGQMGRIDDRRCCLGVACEAYLAAGGAIDVTGDHSLIFGGQKYDLPDDVRRWLGLTTESASFPTADGTNALVGINDQMFLDATKYGAFAPPTDYAPIVAVLEDPPPGLYQESEAYAEAGIVEPLDGPAAT